MAIASSSPAVAARCSHARAGIGVVATQNITDPALGPAILEFLKGGLNASQALHRAVGTTRFASYRQLIVLGVGGAPAVYSGNRALGLAATCVRSDCAAAGNLLDNDAVPASMVADFERSSGHLGHRLLRAMRAGAAQGGEAGPIHSAALLVVREVSWPIVDLRIDWNDEPLPALEALWAVYEPQIEDYVRRALDPGDAPAFDVPGDFAVR